MQKMSKRSYLTINSYEDPKQAYADCLKAMSQMHSSFSKDVDTTKLDVKHALYLLSGNALDGCVLAEKFYDKNYFQPFLNIFRYIIELTSLCEHFVICDDEVKDWFNGEFISTRYTKRNKEKIDKVYPEKSKIPFHFPGVDDLHKVEKMFQENFNFLSKFCHPTIDSVSLGFDYLKKNGQHPLVLKVKFGNDFLRIVINLMNDLARTTFKSVDEIECLRLSEFRVLFYEREF